MDILSYLLSKKYTDSVVSQIANFEMHVLDALPETGQSNIFYAIPSVDEANTYDLYIWAANIGDFKKVGTTTADLTNYYNKQEVDSLINSIDVDLTGYATEDWVQAAIENIDLSGYAEKASLAKVATSGSYDDLTNKPQLFDGDYNSLKNQPVIPSIDGLATEGYVDEAIANIEISEAEIYKVDFNNPNYADAKAAYESGKLLVLINAAPDINSYAVMNYVRDDIISFTKFLMSRSGTYGSFNTYYLHNDGTWELAKEVKLNKVEITNDGDLQVGKQTLEIPSVEGFATEEYVDNKIGEIRLPEAELFVVDFNAPDFAAAAEAYNNGKFLVLANAAPDVTGYAVMNYVRADLITFTKFLTSRSEAYGSFNTYYLSPANTWEVSKEVRLNKVEANPSEEAIGELNKVRIGKEIFTIPQAPTKVSELENDANYTNETKVLELIQNNANTKIGINFVTDITVGHLAAGTEIKADMTFGQLVYRMLFAGTPPEEPEEPVGIKYLSGTFGNSDDEIQEWPEPWISDWTEDEQVEISTHYVSNMIETTVASEEDLVGRHGFAITTPFVKESQSLANYGDTSIDPYITRPAVVLPIGYQVTAWNTDPDNSSLSECTVYSYALTDGRTVYYAADFPQQTGTTVTHYLTIVKN